MVDLTSGSWNQLIDWLTGVEALANRLGAEGPKTPATLSR